MKKTDKVNKWSELRSEPNLKIISCLLIFALGVIWWIVYSFVYILYFEFKFEGYEIVSSEYSFGGVLFAVFCASVIAFYREYLKQHERRFILFAAVLNVFIFACVFYLGTNAWVIKNNTLTYNKLFLKNEIVYTFDDVEEATLNSEKWGKGAPRYKYELKMEDGNVIDIYPFDTIYADESDLIEFDKKLSDKRIVIGSFSDIYFPEDVIPYFASVYGEEY